MEGEKISIFYFFLNIQYIYTITVLVSHVFLCLQVTCAVFSSHVRKGYLERRRAGGRRGCARKLDRHHQPGSSMAMWDECN